MEIEIKLPVLGDGIESGDILELLVRPGDEVAAEQGLAEIETDKATVTLPSPQAGRVSRVHVKVGDTVPVGAPIVSLEVANGAAANTPPPAQPAKSNEAPPADPAAKSPAKAASTSVERPAATPEPAKPAQVEQAPSPKPAASSEPAARKSKTPPPKPVEPAKVEPAPHLDQVQPAGPAVRRFAREVGVDLADVQGTGDGGRITRDDVLAAVRAASQAARGGATSNVSTSAEGDGTNPAAANLLSEGAPPPTLQPPQPQPPVESGEAATDAWGAVRIEKLSRIRRTIATRMHESWTTVPRVTNLDDADVTELERIRLSSKDDYAARGIKLTSLPFVIKAVAMALRSNPVLNASIDVDAGTVTYKQYVHIGIAVDSERGLVVPSLRNADQLAIAEIARQLAALANKVRDNTFAVDDLRGSTFTVSNLGAVGGTYSTPIVNTPEVAILLVGRSRQLPVVIDDQIVPRLMMPLSLSYDHRLVDGAAAARFLNEVIAYLRAPGRLLLAP